MSGVPLVVGSCPEIRTPKLIKTATTKIAKLATFGF
jgi:hypothetical protein